MKKTRPLCALLLGAATSLAVLTGSISAQIVTYQGVLNERGDPADGTYEMKFQFRQPGPPPILFDPPIILPVAVAAGRFSAPLDTAGVPVREQVPLELVICVRRIGEQEWIPLDPPQPVTPTPRAIAADTANNVPESGLPGNVAFTDSPPIFTVPLTGPELQLPELDSQIIFGPTGECRIGIVPPLSGLTESDPFGFRLLGQGGEGCRLLFGPTDECTIEVAPPGAGPGGLLLRDPRGVRVLPPDPNSQASVFYFGPTDLCRLGIDPPGGLTGLVERDPVGLRLAGPGQGSRLLFGDDPDDLCTIGIEPGQREGLIFRDVGCFVFENPDPLGVPELQLPGGLLRFGDECTIGIDPRFTGMTESDPGGFRLLGQDLQGCILRFGPTDDCTIGIDPNREGLILRDRGCFIFENPDPTGFPEVQIGGGTLRFGDECTIGINPQFTGISESDPGGFRLLGQNLQGCRLLFGPTDECTVEVDPQGPPGLLLRDPRGIRILNSLDQATPQLLFGPTDECRLRLGNLPNQQKGLIIEDPGGVQVNAPEAFFNTVLANEFVQTSTRRLKDNIKPIEEPLEKIMQLEGVTFNWKPERGGKAALGFIAEDVGKVFPQVVSYEKDGENARGVNYGHLVAVAVEGIKAQQDQIADLEKENNELKGSLEAMQAQMERLAAQVNALSAQ